LAAERRLALMSASPDVVDQNDNLIHELERFETEVAQDQLVPEFSPLSAIDFGSSDADRVGCSRASIIVNDI
jgi:hypothetical protein